MSAPAVTVREGPILFSGEMVRAILDGRKTQTRRVVSDATSQGNYRASEMLLDAPHVFADPGPSPIGNPGPYLHAPVNCAAICARRGWAPDDCDPDVIDRLYPLYFPGARLWVRENWAIDRCGSRVSLKAEAWPDGWPTDRLVYAADVPLVHFWNQRPSIFMPRWASRLTLEITGVRVERLQEISEADAIAEGVDAVSMAAVPRQATLRRRDDFAQLWDSLNAKRGYPWSSNPWVWVIEFARVAA